MRNFSVVKYISLILVICMIMPSAFIVKAEGSAETKRYIVILEEPALYSEERPMLFSGNKEEYDNEVRRTLISLQENIKAQISPGISLFSDETSFENEYSYTDVLNGFTLTTDAETAEAISEIDGVKEVFPDEIIATIDNETVSDSEDMALFSESSETLSLANSGNMINAPYAYENGYMGEGRAIAILDSTIYYDNSCFMLSNENSVRYTQESLAKIFAEKNIELSAENAYRTTKVPFAYDYESKNYNMNPNITQHGTHVSGIAAGYKIKVGDGIIRGIAPEAQILLFGVVTSDGSVVFSTVAKALDDAVKMGVDSINMSFGAECSSENQTESSSINYRKAIINAENAGCSVVAAAGNSGRGNSIETTEIDYSTASNIFFPSGAKVGSVYNNYRVARKLTDENGNDYASECKSTSAKISLTEIVDCGLGEASEISSLDLTGKVAVISKPDDILADTDNNYFNRAKSAKAAAVIIIDNDEQISDTYPAISSSVPFFIMSKSEGQKLLSNATQIKCEERLMIAKNSDLPMISDASSYGYSDSLDISVDFSAPGGNIYSAYKYYFMPMSGTSMASPHVAGAQVLMSQYVEENYPEYTEKAKVNLIKNLLASTAQTVYADSGAIASVRQTGSGVIQLDKAMQSKIILHDGKSVSRVTLGDNVGKVFDIKFYAENISDDEITFDSISAELSTDDYKYYSEVDKYLFNGIKILETSISGESTVTVDPHSEKEISVTVELSDEDISYLEEAMTNGFFVDGKITLSVSDGSHPSVGIPFTGFYGDWEKITPVDESSINNSITFYSNIGAATLYGVLGRTALGYIMSFTTNPDISVSNSPLSLSLKIRRNIFLDVKLDGESIYSEFIKKNTKVIKEKLIATNSALSKKLEQNGSAVFEISCTLPLNKSTDPDQKIDITVFPRNTKPVIDSIGVTEENGIRTVKLTATGNIVSTILRKGHKTSGEEKIGVITVRKSNKTIGDIVTDFTDASYYIYDSAFNMTALEHDISVEVTDDNKAVFKNTTINEISGMCILATYDDNGKLEEVRCLNEKDTLFSPYRNLEVDISSYANKNYKIFFWKNAESIAPHCSVAE